MSTSSESDHDLDDMPIMDEVHGYQFDPVGEEEISEEEDRELVETREQIIEEFGDTSHWCKDGCRKCQAMPTRIQNRCCRNSDRVMPILQEAGVTCICDHPYTIQLLKDGPLALEYIRYRHYHEDLFPANPTPADVNKKKRFCGYRIMIYWLYPELKHKQRRPLPACLYSMIQAHFPPTDDEELFADWRFSEYAEK